MEIDKIEGAHNHEMLATLRSLCSTQTLHYIQGFAYPSAVTFNES